MEPGNRLQKAKSKLGATRYRRKDRIANLEVVCSDGDLRVSVPLTAVSWTRKDKNSLCAVLRFVVRYPQIW